MHVFRAENLKLREGYNRRELQGDQRYRGYMSPPGQFQSLAARGMGTGYYIGLVVCGCD